MNFCSPHLDCPPLLLLLLAQVKCVVGNLAVPMQGSSDASTRYPGRVKEQYTHMHAHAHARTHIYCMEMKGYLSKAPFTNSPQNLKVVKIHCEDKQKKKNSENFWNCQKIWWSVWKYVHSSYFLKFQHLQGHMYENCATESPFKIIQFLTVDALMSLRRLNVWISVGQHM